jgi:hypothetical protein
MAPNDVVGFALAVAVAVDDDDYDDDVVVVVVVVAAAAVLDVAEHDFAAAFDFGGIAEAACFDFVDVADDSVESVQLGLCKSDAPAPLTVVIDIHQVPSPSSQLPYRLP